jgi:predicted transglutaminase/protease
MLVAKWRTYQISEIKEENKGTVVATTGIVTAISTNNNGFSILIQDATDAIMVYKIDDSQFNYNEFYVGQEVTILAEYTLFNGLSELQNIEKIELGEIKEIPSVVELDTLPDEEILKAMQSKIIKIKLTYLSGEIASKSNANFIDSLGNQIVVRGDSTWGNIDTISLKENQEVIVTGFINWYNGAQITNVGNHQFIEQKDEDLANAILDSLNVPASISQTTDLDKIDGLTWELVTANSNVKVENNQIIVLSNDEETTITILAKYLYKNVEYTKSFDIVIEQATPPLFNNGDKVIIFTKRSSGNYFIMNSDLGTASTKRFQAIDTGTSILNDVTNQAENQVWTIETSGDNYYLKSFDGKYITWSSGNSSNLSDEKYALNITYDGEFYQILSVSDSTRKLQLNNTSGNNYFAFYTSNQAGNLVIQKAQELTDEEKIDIFLNNLEVETSVSDDFSLPESEGLTWSLKDGTSDYAILGDAVVTITRPAIGESDVIVCFVASYTLNGITKTKEFNITILANTSEPQKEWKLVTDVSNLSIGDQIVIVASNYDYALSTTQNKNNRAAASITKQDNIVIIDDSIQILTLTAGTNTNQFGFYTGSGYLYAASSSSNYLRTSDTLNDNGSWSISITTDGIATMKSNGTYTRNWIRYNTSKLFACYSSGQTDVSIYKLS